MRRRGGLAEPGGSRNEETQTLGFLILLEKRHVQMLGAQRCKPPHLRRKVTCCSVLRWRGDGALSTSVEFARPRFDQTSPSLPTMGPGFHEALAASTEHSRCLPLRSLTHLFRRVVTSMEIGPIPTTGFRAFDGFRTPCKTPGSSGATERSHACKFAPLRACGSVLARGCGRAQEASFANRLLRQAQPCVVWNVHIQRMQYVASCLICGVWTCPFKAMSVHASCRNAASVANQQHRNDSFRHSLDFWNGWAVDIPSAVCMFVIAFASGEKRLPIYTSVELAV